jgi:hypothetical protein
MATAREEEIARIDALLAEENGEEVTAPEIEEVEEEEIEEADAPEAKADPEPEPKPEPAAKIEPVKLEVAAPVAESTAWYKLREETRKREAIEAELAELKRPKIAKDEDFEGFLESEIGATKQELAELKAWKEEQEAKKRDEADRDSAFRELNGYEQEAAAAFPDFNEAANYAKSMIAASIKLLNPMISAQELAEQTLNKYAQQAALALNAKKHPGQAIYEAAAQWGYKKAEPEKPKIVIDNSKTQLATLAANKKKSTGMSGSGGSGKSEIGNDELMKMSNAERMRLRPEDWARLEQEA